MTSNYKIVKKYDGAGDRFFIYKRWFFGLFWRNTETCMFLDEAERWIKYDKLASERKKVKPTIVGYY